MTIGGAAAPRPLHGLDEVALVVRLEVLEREAVGLGHRPRRGHVVVERGRAVDLGLALPEQVEVGAAQQQHDRGRVT